MRTRNRIGEMPAPRVARPGGRWIVFYNPLTRAWIAKPREHGRWAEQHLPVRSFHTLAEAADYARSRSLGRKTR